MTVNNYLYAAPPLIASIGNLALGGIVFRQNPRKRLYQICALFTLCAATWSFGFFMVYMNPGHKDVALFWNKFYSVGMVMIPTVFLHYVLVLTQTKKRWLWLACWVSYAVAAGIVLTVPTTLFNRDIILYQWGYSPVRAVAGKIYDATYPFIVALGCIALYDSFMTSTGRRLAQTKYAIAATVVGFTLGLTNFFPLYGIRVYPIGHVGNLLACTLLAYSIIRYSFMDIEVIIKKGIVYSVITALVAGSYVSLIVVSQWLFQSTNIGGSWPAAAVLLGIVLLALIFEPLRSLVQRVVDRLFFKTRYEYQDAIKQFSRMVVTILDLDILLHRTAGAIQDILKISQAVIFVRAADAKRYEVGAFAGADEKTVAVWNYEADDPFVARLKAAQHRVQDVVDDQRRGGIVVSLFIDRDLIGFIVLGEKLSGDVYTPTDFELLSTLADQLAIAIENARLYRAAVTDKLTKVFNGTYFYDRLEEERARSREQKTALSIALFDVDAFTVFAKESGTAVANHALAQIGRVIRENVCTYCIPARIGDDEFGVILPGLDKTEAAFIVGLIQKLVSEIKIDGQVGRLRVSTGIATTDQGVKSGRRLINEGRLALTEKKETPSRRRAKDGEQTS